MESDLVHSEVIQLPESVGSGGMESSSMGIEICSHQGEVVETAVLHSATDYETSFTGDEQFVDSILVPQPIETETVTTDNFETVDLEEPVSTNRCTISKKKRGGARPNAGRKKVHELPRMQRNIRIEISRQVHERYKEQKKKLGFQNDSLFVDHLLLIHQHYIDFYANQSWVAKQHDTSENTSTTIANFPPTTTSSEATVNKGQTMYSETAIQVDSDLFACSQLKATKRSLEWQQRANDDSDAIKKGSKRKSVPQPSSLT